MESRDNFITVLLVILLILYVNKMYETYADGSYDVTRDIIVAQNWKGSSLSTIPNYTNNLETPPQNVLSKIQQLQTYQKSQDGPTDTTWVSTNMGEIPNIDSPENREGFTLMNPYMGN